MQIALSNRLRDRLWFAAVGLTLLLMTLVLAGCGGGGGGAGAPHDIVIDAPDAMADGENGLWTVSWDGGELPYTVALNFGGGANPNQMTIEQKNSGYIVHANPVMLNPGPDATANYTITITVTDAEGHQATADLEYSVSLT